MTQNNPYHVYSSTVSSFSVCNSMGTCYNKKVYPGFGLWEVPTL